MIRIRPIVVFEGQKNCPYSLCDRLSLVADLVSKTSIIALIDMSKSTFKKYLKKQNEILLMTVIFIAIWSWFFYSGEWSDRSHGKFIVFNFFYVGALIYLIFIKKKKPD